MEVYRHSLNECLQLPRLNMRLFFPDEKKKKGGAKSESLVRAVLGVSLGFGLVLIIRNKFLSLFMLFAW